MGEFGYSNNMDGWSHSHDHLTHAAPKTRTRPFYLAMFVNIILFVGTLIAGLTSGSLTLVSNAMHVLFDIAGLVIGVAAQWLSSRPASVRHSFGLVRMEVLGALVTTLLLVVVAVIVSWNAISHLIGSANSISPHSSLEISLFGILGVVVSLLSVGFFSNDDSHTLLNRANVLHFASDVAGWVLAIIAGIVMKVFELASADDIASLAISILIMVGSIKIVASIVNILLDSAPSTESVRLIELMLLEVPGVLEVHHLHVWRLTSASVALSAHLVMTDGMTLHDAQQCSISIKERLAGEFGVSHATLELECHLCDSPTHL